MTSLFYYSENEDNQKEQSINNYKDIFIDYVIHHPNLDDALKQMFISSGINDEDKLNELVNDIKNNCQKIVDKNWKDIHEKYPEINEEEAKIISSYTCECKDSNLSPYKILNNNLTIENREQGIKYVSKYFYILLYSLRKLKIYYPENYLYRCITKKINKNNYIEGKLKYFWGFTSTSTNKECSLNFLKKQIDFKSGTYFSLSGNLWGYDITLFNYYKENEILLEPERQYKILEIDPEINEIIKIRCEIIESPLVIEDIIKSNKMIQNKPINNMIHKRKIKDKKFKWNNLLIFISLLILIGSMYIYQFQYLVEKRTIVGIDFGSSYSGFSIIENGDINGINFKEVTSKSDLISTELIMDKSTYKGLFIGKGKYEKDSLILGNKILFRNFKKNLDPKINRHYAESSLPEEILVPLEKVIQGYLEVLRDDYIISNKLIENKKMNDIKWILTVPALWDEQGKNYMKEIACKALLKEISCKNIDNDKIQIALESEAASLAILYNENIKNKLTKGKSFLLVDAGGYTVDLSANEIIDNNYNLKQISISKSFAFGSNLINEKIIDIIEHIYGKDRIDNTKNDKYSDWEEIINQIEKKKIKINEIYSSQFKINVRFKKKIWCLNYIKGKDCVEEYKGENIVYNSEYIYIPLSIIKNIIYQLASKIIKEIENYIEGQNERIDMIIMTGGFSNCEILQENIKDKLSNSVNELYFLDHPQETVMKGAAIFGLKPNQILYRIIPITIAVETYEKCINGEINCKNYKIIVKKDTSIKTNKIIKKEIYPVSELIYFYYSKNKQFSYKKLLGKLELPINYLPLNKTKVIINIKFSNYISISFSNNEKKWKIFNYP